MLQRLSVGTSVLFGIAASAAVDDCAEKADGTYCVGPVIIPGIFALNHTILTCPGGERKVCPSGMYCGDSSGDPPGKERCELLASAGAASGKSTADTDAADECASKADGTYCVGPVIIPGIFPLNHTILTCPGADRKTCPSGMYCGDSTGDPPGKERCELLASADAVVGESSADASAVDDCAGKADGTYCVGPVLIPGIFPLNHTILTCPAGERKVCPSGMYCGEGTGEPPGKERCELLQSEVAKNTQLYV